MKNKINKFVFISFIIFTFFAFCSSLILAKDLSDNTIVFNNNAEKIEKNIEFVPYDNPNVAKGKMAPGSKAYSDILLDISNLNFDVELDVKLDANYENDFRLYYMIDNNKYAVDDIIDLKSDLNSVNVKLVLEWVPNSVNNSFIGNTYSELAIPIYINLKEKINNNR